MESVRELTRQYLESVLDPDAAALEEEGLVAASHELSDADRGLFHEMAHGTLRQWYFLDFILGTYAKKKPKGKLKTVFQLSAYQILFLDRVPDYAIFSEATKLANRTGANQHETKFLHGVLKSVRENKDEWLEKYDAALRRLREGELGKDPLDHAVLNAPPSLIDTLTVIDPNESETSGHAARKKARAKAVKALAALKERSSLVGYILPESTPVASFQNMSSPVAPRAVVFEPGEALNKDLEEGRVRIQAESSQWACESAAGWIKARVKSLGSRKLRVLEMASGKGGKLLGTLAALGDDAPEIDWVAADISSDQLHILEMDTLPLVKKYWPQVEVQTQKINPTDGWHEIAGEFDFIWLDAPCTGFGTLSKLPQIALKRGEQAYENAQSLSRLQKELCEAGLGLLDKSGAFFYTVCTLTRQRLGK